MLKKPQIICILFVIIITALFLASTKSDYKVRPLSQMSHAENLWKTSGHADSAAEAFKHWDEEGEIPTSCAKCHSTPGFQDFIADGVVDSSAATGTTVECEVCHTNKEQGVLRDHTSVTFPSGALVENLGPEALCMECHQGRASTTSVNKVITGAALADDDTVDPSFRFQNIHYYAAAATQFGTFAKGGYEYTGKSYDARFSHITGYNACYTCHNPHSLEVDLDACSTCHTDPQSSSYFNAIKDPKNIRYYGSFVDYDGDGDMTEGIYYEIQGLQGKLYPSIQRYARHVVGAPIVYDEHNYPYFINDLNNNGEVDSDEVGSSNRYASFTARLLKATYNFQVSKKDPAGYAHGGKYLIQLLYDSIEDLNTKLNNPIDLAAISRTDEGHFDGSAEAWRHWDEDGEVSSGCSKCHSAEGLPYFIENDENEEAPVSNGLLCTTCHTSPPGIRSVDQVTFPSGVSKDMGDSSNICLNCHQGRASKNSIDSKISASSGPYTFTNIHYFPAAAVLYGSEVHGGYEFTGKSYKGQKLFLNHNGRFDTCVECHMSTNSLGDNGNTSESNHNVHKPNPADCVYCHGQDISQPNPGSNPANFKFSGIRPASAPDYDGDGDRSESLENEIKGLEDTLYAQIQLYAANMGEPIIYDSHSYPYFFYDLNGNGIVDPGEASYANGYKSFDAALLKAAYNLQMSKKEPHGFIHNSRYVAQLLVDSIQNLGGDISIYMWR